MNHGSSADGRLVVHHDALEKKKEKKEDEEEEENQRHRRNQKELIKRTLIIIPLSLVAYAGLERIMKRLTGSRSSNPDGILWARRYLSATSACFFFCWL